MLGLADLVIMTEEAYAFVVGPRIVEVFTGVPIDRADLGGARTHSQKTGVASFVVADEAEAEELVAELLDHLPDHNGVEPAGRVCTDPVDRSTPEAFDVLPPTSTGSYDMRDILTPIVDHGLLLEPRADWATNLVTAFATIGGRPVGLVANQPQSMAGTLDIAASQKGARFVAFCDAFNLPLVTFVDTSGFYPGKDLEWRGMIRYGAQMAFAYARATVPRVNVTVRKSYGGAYIVMDSKTMGNDIALAWPSAEIAVMGAKGAVEVLHRKADAAERARLEAAYEERLLNPYIAAERGTIDAVIDPAETRSEIHAALEMLSGKRETLPRRRHDNAPL
jgi:propionyl-CoA carboxylase beta chain